MGVSYGTWVAQQYARTLPAAHRPADPRLGRRPRPPRRLLPGLLQPPAADHARAVRRAALQGRDQGSRRRPRERCSRASAAGRSAAPSSTRTGGPRATRYTTEEELSFLVTSADLNPFMQARLPGAIAAARAGDTAALLHLRRIAEGPPTSTTDLSFGLNVTTSCLDAALPWPADSDPAVRPALAARRAGRDPAGLLRAVVGARRCAARATPTTACCSRARTRRCRPLRAAARRAGARARRPPGHAHPDRERGGDRQAAAALAADRDPRQRPRPARQRRHRLRRARAAHMGGRTAGSPAVRRARRTSSKVLPIPPGSIEDFRHPAAIAGDRGRTLFAVLDSVDDARVSALEAALRRVLAQERRPARREPQRDRRLRRHDDPASLRLRTGGPPDGRLRIQGAQVSGTLRVAGPRVRDAAHRLGRRVGRARRAQRALPAGRCLGSRR